MPLQHTAAFALAAWSLILPPVSRTLRLEMTPDLSKWEVHSVHTTAADCEQERRRIQDDLNASLANEHKPTLRRPARGMLAARYRTARCVSTEELHSQSK